MTARAYATKFPVEQNSNRKLVARLAGRRAGHATGLAQASNKRHGHQIPGSMKKVY